jgi:hypothetical protein
MAVLRLANGICSISLLLHSTVNYKIKCYVNLLGFEILTAVVMRSSIFWDIMPCCPLKANRRFGGDILAEHPLTYNILNDIISQNIELFYGKFALN